MMDQLANGHMAREDFSRRQAAGGKQVGRRVLPISNFRGRKRQLQERVHEALAANSCGNDSSFKHIIIFKRRAEICS